MSPLYTRYKCKHRWVFSGERKSGNLGTTAYICEHCEKIKFAAVLGYF